MKQEEKFSNKCPICGRPTHKESKYCIFHASAEEKTEEDFKMKLKEYVNTIKKEDRDYSFSDFIFVGDIDFKRDFNITVFKNAHFEWSTFERYADFGGATFKGEADLRGATFKGDVVFVGATFKGEAVFRGATFKGIVSFGEAAFEGYADFGEAAFAGIAGFRRTIFKGYARFERATFEGYADFIGATFAGVAGFTRATFKEDADFELKYLVKDLILNEAKVFPGKKWSINVNNGKGKISFERAYLENTYLDIEIVESILIDFTGASLSSTKIEKNKIENHIFQEKKKEFSKANEIYLLLKNNFHSIGKYEEENWAFKKEKDMERKSNCHFKTLHKWLWSCFLNGIFGYGIQPAKVIISAMLIITLFALLFMNPGISNVVGIEEITSNNFFDCVYFSTITFTTLGYGDFRPLEGWGRILAGSEAFIGAFMMALFVYTFARRTGGR